MVLPPKPRFLIRAAVISKFYETILKLLSGRRMLKMAYLSMQLEGNFSMGEFAATQMSIIDILKRK
jgi:hypothetical protein